MVWNHRVLRKPHPNGTVTYHIHEVYYEDDGCIVGWTEEPVTPMDHELHGVRETIRVMGHAVRRPVLEEVATSEGRALVSDESDDAINAGHYWEFLDRAYVAREYIEQFLGSHPVLGKEDGLRAAYSKAAEALAELYQLAGTLYCRAVRTMTCSWGMPLRMDRRLVDLTAA